MAKYKHIHRNAEMWSSLHWDPHSNIHTKIHIYRTGINDLMALKVNSSSNSI